jgi:hypothetical protein
MQFEALDHPVHQPPLAAQGEARQIEFLEFLVSKRIRISFPRSISATIDRFKVDGTGSGSMLGMDRTGSSPPSMLR